MEALRQIILGVVLTDLVLAILWMSRRPRNRGYLIAPFTVVLHIAIFYLARSIYLPISIEAINLWSASIHLHILILVGGGILIFWRRV